jgi:WD40 repeat protein/serine/threonine protein kinase
MSESDGTPAADEEDDETLARIVAEIGEHIEEGETVDQEAYLRRHPEYAGRLRSLWPALVAAADLRRSEGPGGISLDPPSVRTDGSGDGDNSRLGDFRLIREIGRGGMGIVYEAHQSSLRRRVALKVLTAAGAIDDRQLQRFGIEARAAAALQHENIVPVFAVGTERGVPFYVMQLIEGVSLASVIGELRQLEGLEPPGPTSACALTHSLLAGHLAPTPAEGSGPELGTTSSRPVRGGLAPAQSSSRGHGFIRTVAGLGIQAARALEHAHEHGILHRDIKPSNLLVDEAGHLWVTDFGLARVQGESNLTQTGDVLGTLRFMSPESAGGGGKRVLLDGRADVYSLGATLYELLTLRPAFSGDDRVEILRKIAQDEPTPLRKLDRTIPVDLETIVQKAMAKAAADRYATAAELAVDLGRFLDDQSILARRPSLADRSAKWVRRHRRGVAGLAGTMVLVAVALACAGWYYTTQLRTTNKALRAAVALSDRHAFVSTLRLAAQAVQSKEHETAQDLLDSIRINSQGDDRRDFAWHYLHRLARRELVRLPEQEGGVVGVSVTQDGRTLASFHGDSSVVLWDLPSESRRLRITDPNVHLWTLGLTSEGRIVVARRLSQAPESLHDLGIWDATTGELRAVRTAPPLAPDDHFERETIRFVDGERLVAKEWSLEKGRTSVRIWTLDFDPQKHRPLVALDGLDAVAFAPNGPYFVTLQGSQLALRDVTTGAVVLGSQNDSDHVRSLAFSDDGQMLAVATAKHGILVRDTSDWDRQTRYDFGAPVVGLTFDPLGKTLAATDEEFKVRLCDLSSGRVHVLTPDGLGRVREGVDLNFSADGTRLVTSSWGGPSWYQPLVVWDVKSGLRLAALPYRSHDRGLYGPVFAPDGRSIIAVAGRAPRIWHFDPVPDPPSPAGHKDEAWAAAYSPDGKILATGSDDTDEPQTIKLWDPATGQLIRGWYGGVGTVASLAFSPDGRSLASGHLTLRDNVRLWDVSTGRPLQTLQGHQDGVRSVAFAPDGRTLATAGGPMAEAGEDWAIRLWDAAARSCLLELRGHTDLVRSLSFSPDGRRLATASMDRTVRLWDTATGALLRAARGPGQLVGVAFARDGGSVVTADESGLVTIRDASDLAILNTNRGDSDKFTSLAMAPDGRSVATCGVSGTIRLWDTLTGQEMLTLKGHKAQVNGIAFAPDGSSLASCSHDGEVRIWRAR